MGRREVFHKVNGVSAVDRKTFEARKNVLRLVERDLKDNPKAKCTIKVREREVSILPFFIAALSYVETEWSYSTFCSMYAEDETRLFGMALKDEKWYKELIGEEEYCILKGLCGYPNNYISRHLAIGCLANFKDFYRVMLMVMTDEAIEATKAGNLVCEYSEGVQNTMALSYYLSLKWYKDNGYAANTTINIDFVDEAVEQVLSIPGPMKDFLDGKITAKEFRDAQFTGAKIGEKVSKLCPLHKETLEEYGLSTKDIKDVEVDMYARIADALSLVGTNEDLRMFRGELFNICLNAGVVQKIVQDREYLRGEIASAIESKKTSQREVKAAKREVLAANSQIESLKQEVARLKEKSSKMPEETRRTINNLKNTISSKDDELATLRSQLEELTNKYEDKCKETADLKTEVKKLSAKLDKTLEENQVLHEVLDCEKEVDVDCSIPFSTILDGLKGKRVVVLGGMDSIGQILGEYGLDCRQYSPKNNIGTKDLGSYDCLVIMTKIVGHSMTYAPKAEAKRLGRPIVYHNGGNVENLCRQLYSKINTFGGVKG